MPPAEYVPAAQRIDAPVATIAVPADTVNAALSVYVPAPPTPVPSAAIVAPTATAVPEIARMTCPTVMIPTGKGEATTVSVKLAIPAVKEVAPVPARQKEPAGHAVPTGDAALSTHHDPAVQGFAEVDALPVAVQ